MKNTRFILIALGMLASTPVTSGEKSYTAAARGPWTGFYVGGSVGWQDTRGEWEVDWMKTPVVGPNPYSGSGVVGGLHAGYNWLAGANLVLGAEFDIEKADATARSEPGFGAFASPDWQASFRGRLGFAIDSALLYGTAGVAVARFDYGLYVPGDPQNYSTLSDTRVGAVYGGGIEYAISRQWSARIEYMHADFGKSKYTTPIALPPVEQISTIETDSVQAGISYHFN